MAFIPVLSFLLLLAFGSVDSWAVCTKYNSYFYDNSANTMNGTCAAGSITAPAGACNNGSSVTYNYSCYNDGPPYMSGFKFTFCQSWGQFGYYDYYRCGSKCEADSLDCAFSGGIWRPDKCQCLDMTDTIYNCINWSTNSSIYGEPNIALIQVCVGGECHRKTTLNGTCQDWGFCPDGVQSCEIDKDSLGRTPCRRSGAETTSNNVCVYQCVNGQSLRCRPTSTQYVAGAIYVGTCPERPPVSCDPARSSSSVVSSSNSTSSDSHNSSSSGGASSSSACIGDACVDNSSSSNTPPNSSNSSDRDYMPILIAIHDTLVNANDQRRKIVEWGLGPSVQNIDDNTFSNFYETKQINNKLTTFQQNGFNIGGGARNSIDTTAMILGDINDFLHSDSLIFTDHDTSYNPLLRDIKTAIEEQTDSVGGIKPTLKDWFDKYYGDSVQSNGYVGKKLAQITDALESKRDSSLNADCNGYYGCIAVYKDLAYCKRVWGVSGPDCNNSGTPFDNIWNIEADILSTLVDAVWGDDSTELPSVPPLDTTPLPRTPAEDSARKYIKDANDSIDLPSIRRTLDSMRARLDSVKTRKDSVKIDVDSTMLDSSEAARYVQNILLPSGTGTDCFVCHADLGTLGGLAPDGLSIHIDFSSFGGYNWCDLARAIIKVMTLVICVSLTLGSWAAAFGYNPKNDS